MLGYLEQMPLYNASNFSWSVGFGPGFLMNSTVSTRSLSVFVCPSDGLSPIVPSGVWGSNASKSCWQWTGDNNNYFASLGTTTNYGGGSSADTTGPFTQGGHVYGVQSVTDGTSQTIAFGESLIGDGTIQTIKWRDGPVLQVASATGGGLYDASSNPAGVIIDLQACAGLAEPGPYIRHPKPKGV